MAARGYENRLREAQVCQACIISIPLCQRKIQKNLPTKPDLSIPIIPILTPADSEWVCYFKGFILKNVFL